MVVLTGVATGLLGDLLMLILFTAAHLAFGYHSGSFQSGVEHASGLRRVTALAIAGVFGGVAWYLLRRYTKARSPRSTTCCGTAPASCRCAAASARR
jgi:CIC family chloride channel protein